MSISGHEGGRVEPAPSSVSGGLSREQLLVMYGFVKKEHQERWKKEFAPLSDTKRRARVKKLSLKDVQDLADREITEVTDATFGSTHFPAGANRYHLVLESATESIEDSYFTILELLRQNFGFNKVYKVSDYYAASENSAFFGNSQQRLGIQQDRVQQFLANIGKFVKELFQMVRELRIIDERLDIYNASGGLPKIDGAKHGAGHDVSVPGEDHGHAGGGAGGGGDGGHDEQSSEHSSKPKQSHAADVTLKSIFTDLVEGGTKNPQSVFGLASQVGFTLLPDLFFNTYVGNKDDVDNLVDAMRYNNSVKSVLKRKLYQYLVWKEKTYIELVQRRRFNIRYLRQHWVIIKLYMGWVKPYLRNIQRLSMNPEFFESPDIIASFETSYIEIEFIATTEKETDGYHPIVLGTFYFRTRPDMSVRKEYQQGPSHMGKMDVSLRSYGWSPEQLAAYRKMKQREEIELLGVLDNSLADVMEALGEDFEKYLAEAGEELEEDENVPKPEKPQFDSAFTPFASVGKGLFEMFSAFIPVKHLMGGKGHSHGGHSSHGGSPKGAKGKADGVASNTYHIFKKQKRMITW